MAEGTLPTCVSVYTCPEVSAQPHNSYKPNTHRQNIIDVNKHYKAEVNRLWRISTHMCLNMPHYREPVAPTTGLGLSGEALLSVNPPEMTTDRPTLRTHRHAADVFTQATTEILESICRCFYSQVRKGSHVIEDTFRKFRDLIAMERPKILHKKKQQLSQSTFRTENHQ